MDNKPERNFGESEASYKCRLVTMERDELKRENTELAALLALSDERAKLHQVTNEELMAHVGRLRGPLETYAEMEWSEGEGANLATNALTETPAQSLQAIKADI